MSKLRFEREMKLYASQVKVDKVDRVYLVLASVIRWLRDEGHGSCSLHAVENVFNVKFQANTIVNAKK